MAGVVRGPRVVRLGSALRAVWAWGEPAVDAVLWLAVCAVHPRGWGALGRSAALRSDTAAKGRRCAARPGPVAFGRLGGLWWKRSGPEPTRPEAGAHATRRTARRWPVEMDDVIKLERTVVSINDKRQR